MRLAEIVMGVDGFVGFPQAPRHSNRRRFASNLHSAGYRLATYLCRYSE